MFRLLLRYRHKFLHDVFLSTFSPQQVLVHCQQSCLHSYGNAAQNWVQSRFSTQGVATQVHELYQSLTLDTFVQEIIKTRKLTPDLERQIQKLLKSKVLKSNEIKALEKLIYSFYFNSHQLGLSLLLLIIKPCFPNNI